MDIIGRKRKLEVKREGPGLVELEAPGGRGKLKLNFNKIDYSSYTVPVDSN